MQCPQCRHVNPAGTKFCGEMKRDAFETIERNADQIALLGDSLFYFGEPGRAVVPR